MAPLLQIDPDATALLKALQTLGVQAEALVKAAAKETAERIQNEARGRVARATGDTAEGITVEETHDGTGYVVFVNRASQPGLPQWLEFGTKFIGARPFLFSSAAIEVGGHMRRVAEAVQDAIDAQGLGD
ncbi:MAG TPA: HK97 gp10 family phage protein [Vicinamibacterales bacterium]|nr:HK97 gp10 family phage protein [Vicinamibacterales bacterium]